MSSRSLSIILFCLVIFSACSRVHQKESHLFYGDCRVSVNAKPSDAEIMIDGIPVGHHKVLVEIPCGEKQLLVEKTGYVPFYEYRVVSADAPLVVNVELIKAERVEDYALSRELIEQVRNGKKLKNPFKEGSKNEADASGETDEEVSPIALDMGSAVAAGGGGESLPPGDVNSVDYWR
jgi:hypothetical protein